MKSTHRKRKRCKRCKVKTLHTVYHDGAEVCHMCGCYVEDGRVLKAHTGRTAGCNATIVEVKGPDIRMGDSFTGNRYDYGNFVRVRENNGTEYILINGSINQVAPENRVVGLRGTIVWHRTTSYNLPFFSTKRAEKEPA